ncbi:MAG: hypothetical protein ACUVSU_04680 [Aggregatilineaceae bacterium]
MAQQRKSQSANARNQAERALNQLGVDTGLGIQVVIIALVSGIVAALIDRILDLPTDALVFMFGWGLIAALNGPLYYLLKGTKESLAATVMSAVTGFAALLAWWIVTKLVGERDFGYNPADQYNLLELLVSGVVVGLLSYGWFVLVRRLPGLLRR